MKHLAWRMGMVCLVGAWAGMARAVDVPPSGSVNVSLATAPGSDWKWANITGGSGDVNSEATMDAKVVSPGPGTYSAIPTLAYVNGQSATYYGRTIYSTPASVAASTFRVAVTNKTGASLSGLMLNYTVCVPFANGTVVDELPRGFMVYYTANASGVGGWTKIGNHYPPTKDLGSKADISCTVSPAGGWANNAPLYVMWADDNASLNDVCYAVSNLTF